MTLGLGKKDGVVAGIDMEIYREGRELRHPKTGASLGRTEQAVGRMQVQAGVRSLFDRHGEPRAPTFGPGTGPVSRRARSG